MVSESTLRQKGSPVPDLRSTLDSAGINSLGFLRSLIAAVTSTHEM